MVGAAVSTTSLVGVDVGTDVGGEAVGDAAAVGASSPPSVRDSSHDPPVPQIPLSQSESEAHSSPMPLIFSEQAPPEHMLESQSLFL